MSAVAESLRKIATKTEKVSKKSKKSIGGDEEAGDEEKKEKKDKKDKKRSKEVADAADEVVEEDEGKKKKKKKVRLTFDITWIISQIGIVWRFLTLTFLLLISFVSFLSTFRSPWVARKL